ncbi:MAG: hypothetical protein KAI70_05475 [Candidatus Omnitrophica bacterium]|nr:hypothetical protein [Candidatus Omnitrophota bacterium]
MACVYLYQGKSLSKDEFVKELLDMKPSEASKYMPGVTSIPDVPFIKSDTAWSMLGIKKAIQYAATNGFDKIAWPSTPEQIYEIEGWGEVIKEDGRYKNLDGENDVTAIVNRYLVDLPRNVNRFLKSQIKTDVKVEKAEIPTHKPRKKITLGGEETGKMVTTTSPVTINSVDISSFAEQVRREGVPLFSMAGKKAVTEKAPMFSKQATTFQDTLGLTTEEDLAINRKHQKDIKRAAFNSIKRVAAEIKEGADKFLGSISTRLGNISPKIKAKMRRLDFDIGILHAKDVETVEGMLRKEKKMTRDDYADFDYARKNSAIEVIDRLVDKYNMRTEYQAYRDTLDRIAKEAHDVGLVFGEIEEYAPRILKDSKGFLTAIGKADEWPVYSDAIKEKAHELDIDVDTLDVDQRANIISSMILGGWSGLGGVSAMKHRKLKKIPPELNQYYMGSDAALMQHLYSMRKLIEARKFFGKIPAKVTEMRKRMYQAQSRIRQLTKEIAAATDEKEIQKLKRRKNKNIGLEKQYTAYITAYATQRDYKENIGVYVDELIVNEEVKPKHERVLNEILIARFHEKGTRGLVQSYKNLSYIDTMGSPISALTQIGDLAWAMYEGGMIKTLKHAYKSIRKRSRITKEDVGVSRIAQEFADAGTLSSAVNTVFKLVGLEKIDSIGKETLMNTALEKYQEQAKENPAELKKQIGSIFEGETDNVINDLIKDKITDNVKLLVYSRLLDFQPVALSEMPQKYLDAGNGRLFYMLKTFTLKSFDVFRNEAYNKIKKGDVQGFKNLVRLACFFVLANAGADEIKDFFLRRHTDFEDRVTDNILRLFGVSKFVTWKARTEGVGSALSRQILPPFKFIDAAGKDILHAGDEKGLEVMASIPIAGKLAYWHFFRGKHKREDLWDRRLRKKKAELNKVKNKLDTSKNKREFKHKYHTELLELKKINEFQGELNQIKKRINKLKSLTESITRKEYIQKLTLKRTNMIKLYLK